MWDRTWRPQALRRLERIDESPRGFERLSLSGSGPLSGFSCEIIEPMELAEVSDWLEIISDLKSWGEVPDPDKLERVTISENNRGPIGILSGEEDWIAEFLPWGSDSLMRKRIQISQRICDVPCGGFSWRDSNLILIRRKVPQFPSFNDLLFDALTSDDKDEAIAILNKSGKKLGSFHGTAESVRVTPYDPKRWNSRIAKMEEDLRARSIWRAPYSRFSDCMISIGDIRFDHISEDSLKICRPRLSDALMRPVCEFPAIRDLASLVHDLSRLHYSSGSKLDIIELRSHLIESWRESAPSRWSSDNVFYTHRGGLAIWEYEQCLMDVLEASSNQSGPPQPALGLIEYVPSFQKKMFNNRTIGALSIMAAFFGLTTIYASFPPSLDEIIIPGLCLLASAALMAVYRGMSPSPEIPFNRLD